MCIFVQVIETELFKGIVDSYFLLSEYKIPRASFRLLGKLSAFKAYIKDIYKNSKSIGIIGGISNSLYCNRCWWMLVEVGLGEVG